MVIWDGVVMKEHAIDFQSNLFIRDKYCQNYIHIPQQRRCCNQLRNIEVEEYKYLLR